MTIPLPADAAGRIASGLGPHAQLAEPATVDCLRPGLGRSLELDQLVVRLYRRSPSRWFSTPTR